MSQEQTAPVVDKVIRVIVERNDGIYELVGEDAALWDQHITNCAVMSVIHGGAVPSFNWKKIAKSSVMNKVTEAAMTVKEKAMFARQKVEGAFASSVVKLGTSLMDFGTKKLFTPEMTEETHDGE